MTSSNKTAGKRTARPGSKALDRQAAIKARVKRTTAGKKLVRITGKNVNAHIRARGKRSRMGK